LMAGDKDVEREYKRLLKERDRLVDELRKLKKRYETGELDDETYNRNRYDIERQIVEVMDRIAQLKFLLGITD
jgi:HEPN domain-containing protein